MKGGIQMDFKIDKRVPKVFDLSRHIMIDIETLGTLPGSVILSIGACTLDMNFKFYQTIDPDSCVKAGLSADINTMRWWDSQEDKIREEAFSGTIPLLNSLLNLNGWIELVRGDKSDELNFWCNGASFDFPLLNVAYNKVDVKPMWNYFELRDYRTLKNLYPDVLMMRHKDKHNALADAIAQAEHLKEIFNIL